MNYISANPTAIRHLNLINPADYGLTTTISVIFMVMPTHTKVRFLLKMGTLLYIYHT